MADQFLGEIRAFSFNFAPKGWATCQGQQLPINQNTALFSLLGTAYGGDGRTNFNLPDLQGRTPIGVGTAQGISYAPGNTGGAETVTLQTTSLPAHIHSMNAVSSAGNQPQAGGGRPSTVGIAVVGATPVPIYAVLGAGPAVVLASDTVGFAGAGGAHNNIQPSLVLNYCIALQGIYPSRN